MAFIAYSLILFLEKVALNSHELTMHKHEKHSKNEGGDNRKIEEENEGIDDIKVPLLKDENEVLIDQNEGLILEELKLGRKSSEIEKILQQKEIMKNKFKLKFYELNKDAVSSKSNRSYKSGDESDVDEKIIKNTVSSKGQFASFLYARNISK